MGDGVILLADQRGGLVPTAELYDPPDEDYSLDSQVPDAGSLVIMLRTEDRERLVKVVLPNPEDSGARGDAAEFAESLRPSRCPAGDFTRPPARYRPDRVAVTYNIATSGDDVPRTWPLPEAEPIQPRCVVLTGTAATLAQELGETVPRTTRWQHRDATFYAWIRPLLPDEADCDATERRYLE